MARETGNTGHPISCRYINVRCIMLGGSEIERVPQEDRAYDVCYCSNSFILCVNLIGILVVLYCIIYNII